MERGQFQVRKTYLYSVDTLAGLAASWLEGSKLRSRSSVWGRHIAFGGTKKRPNLMSHSQIYHIYTANEKQKAHEIFKAHTLI